MSASPEHTHYPAAAVPGQAWNTSRAIWGACFIISTVVYALVLQAANFGLSFVPFGGLGAFLGGVPIGALVFKYIFTALTGGIQPTVSQGALAVTIAVGPPLTALTGPVSLALDDRASPVMLVLVGVVLLALNVAWGVLAMHLQKKSARKK